MTRPLAVRDLGLVEYDDALEMQERFVASRLARECSDTLLLVEHPPVITKGRGAKAEHILSTEGVEVFDTPRGGDVTYHGPGQIVAYPVFDLNPDRRDVRKFVCGLERAVIKALARFGIAATLRDKTIGVFVGNDKIAALGVRLSRWITSHGVALNVSTDLASFNRIVPCGLRDVGVTSMERVLASPVNFVEVKKALVDEVATEFGLSAAWEPVDCSSILVVVCAGRRVLLLKRLEEWGGFWQPITGRIDRGESPHAAAVRELREETGLGDNVRVDPLGYVHAFALSKPGPARIGREHAFVARLEFERPVQLSPTEHSLQMWLDVDEAVTKVPYKGLKRAMQLATGR
ncbi:MAG: lipoyl(octanoyl) transferase LipB [Deltaproteobacteria bacterium]|nr:lipoyl(octanoyl) transferase LipB [Deltaproteobacteria bacterium]